jgi:phospholipid/cholesterol/gamma-HCH transport system permease protein
MSAVRKPPSMIIDSIAQVGACGLFLLQVLAAVPRSLRHFRETVRQVWFTGAMSLVIIMTCGLFVGMVLGLQLYYVLSIFGGTAALGTVVSLSL